MTEPEAETNNAPRGPLFYLSGFENLRRTMSSAPAADTNIHAIRELHEKSKALMLLETQFYRGPKALWDMLNSMRASGTQKIGRKVISQDYWGRLGNYLDGHEIPKSGDSYEKLYTLKEELKEDLEMYEEYKTKIREVNGLMTDLEWELRSLSDGNAQPSLMKVVSADWLSVMTDTPQASLTMKTLRWGDVGSSSEDELFRCAVNSLNKEPTVTTPGVVLPEDFDTAFPMLWRRINQFCSAHEWSVEKEQGTRLRNQGLVIFEEKPDGTIDSNRLSDNHRLALASLYTSVAALFIKPQSLVNENSTEVALTFACSLIAKEQLAKDNPELLKIALKNGDGGEATLSGRLHSLCSTGSSAIKLVIVTIKKLLSKFARELTKDALDDETVQEITKRSFTSIDGMIDNCFRTTLVDGAKLDDSTNRRGKTTKTYIKVKKVHKVVPDLTAARAPLKPQEIAKVNELRLKFNNRKAVVETRLGQVTESTILDRPKVCQEVVQEAYSKIQGYKALLKQRLAAIRAKATSLNSGKKPNPDQWIQAQAEVLAETSDIPEAIFNGLKWD